MMDASHPMYYADQVISGKVPACKLVRLAIERHLDDLEKAPARGYLFSEAHGMQIINFAEKILRWTKGQRAGQQVMLEPWQRFHLYTLYGWRVDDARRARRFRKSYLEIPRKNGKTTLAAIVLLFSAFFEREPRAQNYTVATKRDQAKICLNDARAFVNSSPALKKELDTQTNSIFIRNRGGRLTDDNFIQALSSDSNTMDGLDIHCAVVDELHAHRTRELLDVILTAIGARENPLIYQITTAGSNKESVCFEQRQYLEAILNREVEDDSYTGMIFTLDQGDDFRNPDVWIKANPNLNISKYADYMETQITQANNMQGYEAAVKRLDFNIWTSGSEDWVNAQHWRDLKVSEVNYDQFPYKYAGLDLAATMDFNALALFFANPEEERYYLELYFWIPEDGFSSRKNKLPELIQSARKHPRVMITPGNVMEDRRIAEDIINICEQREIQKMSYDPAHAHSGVIQDIVRRLGEEFTYPQSQGIMSMSEPTKQFGKIIMSSKLAHDGNPVMNWMIGNVKIYRDANDNIKMHKGRSSEKIDGPVSAVNAIALYMSDSIDGFESSLEENDLLFV
jgi:phage terminase large subunit-like protein